MVKYQNYQIEAECQLVSLINIHYYFTGKIFTNPRNDSYGRILDEYDGRYGSCLGLSKLWKKMGYSFEGYSKKKKINVKNIPLECSIWHEDVGHHSVAVVGVKEVDGKVMLLVPNFTRETKKMWIEKSNLEKCLYCMYDERKSGRFLNRSCQKKVRRK